MSAAMTGWREADGGGGRLVLERRFRAPREDVWAAVTEPGRLERWIGTWSGDPADGQVAFRMTAEGEDVAAETMRIEECEPPSRLRLVSDGWVLELDLAETPTADGVVTTLRFAQVMPLPESAAEIGPGWEYYLDRLAAVLAGRDAAGVAWDEYPALGAPYAAAFADD